MAEEKGLVEYLSRDGQQIKLNFDTVRKFLVSGKPELVTDQEIMLYIGMAKARGLNPFKRDCYLVKYTPDAPAATIVSIDYFRSRAKAQEDCQGWKSGVIVKDRVGELTYRNGAFTLPGDTLLGGWFKARPVNWIDEYEWTINLKPYVKTTRDGTATAFWRDDNQPYMIAKVAESQGLRRLWPDEFQGLFVADEIIETSATPEREPRAILPEPVRKVNQKEIKRFFEACYQKQLNNAEIADKLGEYQYKDAHEIMTDKLPELMLWATGADKGSPPQG